MFKKFAQAYLDDLIKSLNQIPLHQLDEIVALLRGVYSAGRRIYVMGNGGSSATASHFVNDFAKGSGVKGQKQFRVTCLTDNVPLITAWANDLSYDEIFSAQLSPVLEKGDLVLVFSGSGNSKNILRAVECANATGIWTIAFTGFKGGKVKEIAKTCLVVPSDNMQRIEDIHLILTHILFLYFLEEIREGRLS